MHCELCFPYKVPSAKAVFSIDYTGPAVIAIRTEPGKPEEKQELRPGSKGLAVCKWADGQIFESDVANLVLESRAKNWAVKRKPAACAAGSGAKKKPATQSCSSEDADEGPEEEEAEEKKPAEMVAKVPSSSWKQDF